MNLIATLWGVLNFSISKKMRFVHMDIRNQISPMCNVSDFVNKYWNLVCSMVEAMSSLISTQNYNIAASLISLLSKVNLNSKRVLGTKWLCREQSESLVKQLINGNKGKELRKEKAFRSYFSFLAFFLISLSFASLRSSQKKIWLNSVFGESRSAIQTHFPGKAVAQKVVVQVVICSNCAKKNPAVVFSFSLLCCSQKYKV